MNIELTYQDQVERVKIPAKVILPVIRHAGYPGFAEETWGDRLTPLREIKNKIPSFRLTKHGGLILFNLKRNPKDTSTFSCIGESLCIRVDEEKGTIQTSFHKDVTMNISLMYHSQDYELSVCSVGESPWWDGTSVDIVVHAENAHALKGALEKEFCLERVLYYPEDNHVTKGCERFLIPDVISSETANAGKTHSVALKTPLGTVSLKVSADSKYALLLAPNDDPDTNDCLGYLPCSIPLFQMTKQSRFRFDATRVPVGKGLVLLTDFCLLTRQEDEDIVDYAGRPADSFTARARYVGPSPSENAFYDSADPEDLSLNVLSTRCVYGRIFQTHFISEHLAPKGFVIMTMVFPETTMDLSFPIDADKLVETLRMVPTPRMIDCHNGAFGHSLSAEAARRALDEGVEGLQTLRCHYTFHLADIAESHLLSSSIAELDKKSKDNGSH